MGRLRDSHAPAVDRQTSILLRRPPMRAPALRNERVLMLKLSSRAAARILPLALAAAAATAATRSARAELQAYTVNFPSTPVDVNMSADPFVHWDPFASYFALFTNVPAYSQIIDLRFNGITV